MLVAAQRRHLLQHHATIDHIVPAFRRGATAWLPAHLAGLEIHLMLEELIRRRFEVHLNGKPEPMASLQIRGLKRMPVRLAPPLVQA